MAYRDLRHFIETLEEMGELKHIHAPVSQDLEISEITDRISKAGGSALLFHNVTGHTIPVLINALGSKKRMMTGLGLTSYETFFAIRGKGATLNGRRIRVSSVRKLSKSLLCTGFPYDIHDHPERSLPYFNRNPDFPGTSTPQKEQGAWEGFMYLPKFTLMLGASSIIPPARWVVV